MNENENKSGAVVEIASNSSLQEISILDIVALMLKNWWIIAIIAIVFGASVYAYSKSVSVPSYQSTATLYINTQKEQKSEDINTGALINAQSLMPTYVQILHSRTFCEKLSKKTGGKYSVGELISMTSFSDVNDTNLLTVTVTSLDKQDAYNVCNLVIDNVGGEILRVFEGGSVKIIDRPDANPKMVIANSVKKGTVGMIVGAVIAILLIFLVNLFDTRIESTEELLKYGIPILGEMPNLSDTQ